MAKIGFVSLGCPKNLVDTEVMLGTLSRGGHEITTSQADAEVIVVNTCGFIDPAKEESINTILEMAAYKTLGKCKRLVVAGCLVERYRKELLSEIPEVDAVIGTNELPRILEACDPSAAPANTPGNGLYLYSDSDFRILATPSHSAYVKVAEGCDHPCTFCVIPQMRGRFRSREPESIVREVERLADQGVVEVNLIGQDTSMYGHDLAERPRLSSLLRALDRVDGIEWIRFLYAYPNSVSNDLLEAIADCQKVCKYIDMPLQSASREVLKRMKRGGNRAALTRLIEKIRRQIPGVSLRTTMIVGFPGETEADFQETCAFVEEVEFDRLGAFTYSDEEHAVSNALDGKVDEQTKQERISRLMTLQAGISKRRNRTLVGREFPVLLEGLSRETDLLWEGRMASQAPEIDGVVYLNDGVTESMRPGEIRNVLITEGHEYDLVGEVRV
jgi:ribosomal protein S12 methylthiotransferase